eukprot:scaffold769_cov278-Pavlova_lutheri.AAC.7
MEMAAAADQRTRTWRRHVCVCVCVGPRMEKQRSTSRTRGGRFRRWNRAGKDDGRDVGMVEGDGLERHGSHAPLARRCLETPEEPHRLSSGRYWNPLEGTAAVRTP